MVDIPNPVETGSSGTQTPAPQALVALEPQTPFEGLYLARTVEGLASTKSRSMGGEVAANLIAGSFQQLSYDLQEAKQELRTTQERLNQTCESLSECKQRAAVLEERLRNTSKNRHLKNLCISAGIALIGIAIEFMRNKMDNLFYVSGILGILLILFGWLTTGGEVEK